MFVAAAPTDSRTSSPPGHGSATAHHASACGLAPPQPATTIAAAVIAGSVDLTPSAYPAAGLEAHRLRRPAVDGDVVALHHVDGARARRRIPGAVEGLEVDRVHAAVAVALALGAQLHVRRIDDHDVVHRAAIAGI